jgi:hypothetical protein
MRTFAPEPNDERMITTATLKFPTRDDAERFASAWSRFTKDGHTVGAGTTDVTVTVTNVDDSRKEWIEKYVVNNFPS